MGKLIKVLVILGIVAAAGAYLYTKLTCNCDDDKCSC
jgi:hypothetical protein